MTLEELGVHIKYMREALDEMKEKDLPKRVQKLEFWRNAIVWGTGVIVSGAVLLLPLVYKKIKEDWRIENTATIKEEISLALDDLVIDEIK